MAHHTYLSNTDTFVEKLVRSNWRFLRHKQKLHSHHPQSSAQRLKRPIHSQLNRAILLCDVIPEGKTDWTAQFSQPIAKASKLSFPVVFHTENCAVHSGNPTVSSVYLPTPRWHPHRVHPFLAIHSADVPRMIYSFSNTTSYSIFYAFFSSFRITLWPMWLANSKRQPCFYPP
jgi:hypothetical protein